MIPFIAKLFKNERPGAASSTGMSTGDRAGSSSSDSYHQPQDVVDLGGANTSDGIGYATSDRGFSTGDSGFSTGDSGFSTGDSGFSSGDSGFSTCDSGFSSGDSGFSSGDGASSGDGCFPF